MSACLRRPEGGSLPTTRFLHSQVLEGRIGVGGQGPFLKRLWLHGVNNLNLHYWTVIASVEQINLFYFRNHIFFINIFYIFFIYIFKYIFITHLSLCLWYLENCNVRLVTKMARDKKWDHFLWNSKIYSGSGWRYQFFFTSFNLLLKYEIAFCFFLTCNFHNIWIIILQHVQANSVLSMVMILKYIREFLKNFKQQLCGSVTRLSHLVYGSGLL